MKILTVCRAGLVRSVALKDILTLHYEPTDILASGIDFNSKETLTMLFSWAERIVVMEEHYQDRIPIEYQKKTLVCEVGPDTYGSSRNPLLIDMVWRWVREHKDKLGIIEHNKNL